MLNRKRNDCRLSSLNELMALTILIIKSMHKLLQYPRLLFSSYKIWMFDLITAFVQCTNSNILFKLNSVQITNNFFALDNVTHKVISI